MFAPLVARFREHYQQAGVAAAVSAGVRKLLRPVVDFDGLLFFECDLRQPLGTAPQAGAFEVREATAADLSLLDALEDGARRRTQAGERLARGERWFVGLDRATGQLANFRWVTTAGYIPEIRRDLITPPGEVYIYDLYTARRFRRRGVDAAVRHAVYTQLRDAGTRRIYAYIAASNHASLRAARRLLTPIGRVWYVAVRGMPPVVAGVQALRRSAGLELCRSRVRRSRSRSTESSKSVGA